MSQQDAFAEAVFFFERDDIAVEIHYAEFEALLNQSATLENFAASQVRGAYAVIGTGLAVRGLVTFLLRIDENGHADPTFSVPLRHLVRHAGPGPDIGCGTIRLASRAQCSVSWHAMNLWEPEGEGEANPVRVIQRAVWRNRLGVKLSKAEPGGDAPFVDLAGGVDEPPPSARPEPQAAKAGPKPAAKKITKPPVKADEKIDQAFGEEGRISLTQLIQQHNNSVDSLTRKYRLDLEQQQQIYLDQIRGCRDEIQRLKGLLRHEQNRNRRLQQLLRGEVGH